MTTLEERVARRVDELRPRAELIAAYVPLTVPCPTCSVLMGQLCKTAAGNYATGFHSARRKAIAHLSTEERLVAYAQMKVRQEQLRAETAERIKRSRWSDGEATP